jgi:hypothetical protein
VAFRVLIAGENRIRQMMAFGNREWSQMLAAATSEVLETMFFAVPAAQIGAMVWELACRWPGRRYSRSLA